MNKNDKLLRRILLEQDTLRLIFNLKINEEVDTRECVKNNLNHKAE